MKKTALLFICLMTLSCEYSDAIRKASESISVKPNVVTNDEAIAALKDALTEGIKYSTKTLSAKDGYYKNALLKIALPKEAESIIKSIDLIPGGKDLMETVVENINRSAEEAAKEAMPIFENALKSMTIADGINIVKGSDTAATEYFKTKTYKDLTALYSSKINKYLDKPFVLNISANSSWKALVDANNSAAETAVGKIAGMKTVKNESLGAYATEKALDGLFYMVSEEEKKVRKDPFAYASEMIKKVFGGKLQGKL